MIKSVDLMGSASSLDVFFVAALITVKYFGAIVRATTKCFKPPENPDIIEAEGEMMIGFLFIGLFALVQLILIEMVTKVRLAMPVVSDSAEKNRADPDKGKQVVADATEVAPGRPADTEAQAIANAETGPSTNNPKQKYDDVNV